MKDHSYQRFGPWAAVTGATGLLGHAFCLELAARGFNLHLIGKSAQRLRDLEATLKLDFQIKTNIASVDLTESKKTFGLVSRLNAHGEIGLLILNAGIFPYGPFDDIDTDLHLQTVGLNCTAPLMMAYDFLRLSVVRPRRGLIFVSSVQSKQGVPFMSAYAASKAFNDILAQSLWYEYRDRGVDIQSLCPGRIQRPDRAPVRGSLPPSTVVSVSLDALGKKLCVVPGFTNRLFIAITSLFSAETRSTIMGKMLKPKQPDPRPTAHNSG